MKRGDVVLLEFPYTDGRNGKNRPAVVLQNNRDNQRLANTIVAMVSGNTRHANEPTQVLVDPAEPIGQTSGLHGVSVIKCNNLYTVRQQDVKRVLGKVSDDLQTQVNDALARVLGL
jgi:mRNA interferase MazF